MTSVLFVPVAQIADDEVDSDKEAHLFRGAKKPTLPVTTTYLNVFKQVFPDCALDRRPISSVGRAPDCRAGGRGFKPRPDQHSGSLNNLGERAAFVMTPANG